MKKQIKCFFLLFIKCSIFISKYPLIFVNSVYIHISYQNMQNVIVILSLNMESD